MATPPERSRNPLRSEAAMFRIVVIVAAGAAAVIAVALLTTPLAGAIVALVLLAYWLWTALRSRSPETPPEKGDGLTGK